MLEHVAGIGTLCFILVSAAVGVRLLGLWRRTRGLPEFTLGLGLLLVVGIGYPIVLVARGAGAESLSLARTLMIAGMVSMSVGWISVWIFTWKVFRPEGVGAAGFALSGIGAQAACLGLSAATLWSAVRLEDLWSPSSAQLGTQLGALTLYVWTGCEAFTHYGRQRKRLALGLADPVVANRILLWAIVTVFSFSGLIGPFVMGVLGRDPTRSPMILATTAIAGLACSLTMYLAFFPPEGYKRWLVRGGVATA